MASMNLTLQQASAIVDGALAKARALKLRPMTIVVLDAAGVLKAMKREDGSGLIGPDIVLGKAFGAVAMRRSSRENGERFGPNPALLAGITASAGGRFVAAPGAVLIHAADG
jgi:uncharacterized protein GlcG (DUF336 family)